MEYPVKCKSCAKGLYGPVKYCPFCGQIAHSPFSAGEEVDHTRDSNIDRVEAVIAKKQEEEKPSAIDGQDDEAVKVEPGQADTFLVGSSDKRKVIETVEDGAKRDSPDEKQTISNHRINVTAGDVLAPPPSPRRWIIGALCLIGIIGSLSLYILMKHSPPPENGNSSAPSEVTESNIVSKPKGTVRNADGKYPDTRRRKAKEIKEIKDAMMNPDKKHAQDDLARKPEQKGKLGEVGDAGALETLEEMLNKGIGLYERKQYAAAAASFTAVLKMVPNNSVAKYYLEKSIDGQKQAENEVEVAK